MQITAREEILVELFRGLHLEQRNEVIKQMRALIDANAYTKAKLGGKPLKLVADARIEARFGRTPPPSPPQSKTGRRPAPRSPDRNQDDAAPEV